MPKREAANAIEALMRDTCKPWKDIAEHALKAAEDALAQLEKIGKAVDIVLAKPLKDTICPECRTPFVLDTNTILDKGYGGRGYAPDFRIKCPHCSYEEQL